jgi:hypothetical protein
LKVTQPKNTYERKFTINLITSDRFCKEVIPLIHPKYFETIYAREVSAWCIEYYNQFSKAPGKDIKSLYHSKRPLIHDDETVDLVSDFLASLSKEFEETDINNIDYEVKFAIKYLKIRSLDIVSESIQSAVLENNPEKGEHVLSSYKRVEKVIGQGIDLLKDTALIMNAFTKENDVIITFPGALGKIIQPITRGSFPAFFGPAKRGKSFWLWYTAELGMGQGCKILYITLEMTENNIIRRSWPSLIGQPVESKTIHSAYFEKDDDELFKIVQKQEVKEGLNLDSIGEFQKKLKRLYRKGAIKIVFPIEPLTVSTLESILDNLEYYENFIPDAVVIDYADYMAPDTTFKGSDNRNIINNIWTGLRQLALKKNLAIVTASHTAKITFDTDIKTSHASEDIRKINNVTMAIGLNQTDEEKENNVMRVGLMEIREGRKTRDQAVVLQCLDIGRPCIDSRLRKECIKYKNESTYKRKS